MSGKDQRVDSRMEPMSSTEPTQLEAWLCSSVTVKRSKQFLWALLAIPCAFLVAILVNFGGEVWRVSSTEKTLGNMQAEYAWIYETLYLSSEKPPKWACESWARKLGNPLVSDISLVKIQQGHPSDEQLHFLKNLREVRAFELRSNRATDKTLELISRLPNLRYLTLVGNNFSIMGLLKLRDAPCLTLIRVDTQQYSPIELAVLQQELPGVQVLNARTNLYDREQRDGHGFNPAA